MFYNANYGNYSSVIRTDENSDTIVDYDYLTVLSTSDIVEE